MPAQNLPVTSTTELPAAISVNDDDHLDEISNWLSVRYVPTIEACWRIMGKRTHSCQPAIKRLAVHLQNQQNVTFSEGANNSEIQRAMDRDTTLTAYLKLNATDADARRLLLHVKGATSFEELKTTATFDDDGIHSTGTRTWPTFREAAQALNLLEDSKKWDRAMTEAFMLCNSSVKIRELFAILLIFNFVSNYKEIWDNHKDKLSADFEYTYRQGLPGRGLDLQGYPVDLCERDYKLILNQTIVDIAHRLLKNQKDIKNFPELPQPDPSSYNTYMARTHSFYDHEIGQYDADDLVVNVAVYEGDEDGSLNAEQRVKYDEIVSAIYDHSNTTPTPIRSSFFFIDGPGGTGKTFLYNALLAKVRPNGEIALACASSGIAATLLPGGRTAHLLFQIPIDIDESSLCNIKLQDISAQVISDSNRLLQEITGNFHLPFGRKVVVLGGDFRQTLPIIKFGSLSDVIDACVINSVLFRDCRVLRLKRNMTLTGDSILDNGTPFQDYLLEVGEGRCQVYDQYVSIPASIVTYAESIEDVVTDVFGDSLSTEDCYKNRKFIVSKAILAAHNSTVDEINELATEKLPGIAMVYLPDDSIEET
ncbi:hypothetical protein INT47_012068 [Mucor saturninus]|uniref:ATP-dependent DNA helicase n=1 Tax=Mucor saturninus TaxID=64648 RepID=A0A8H7UQG1_9FUNG|nr:hypothetical protein INT47_012068 [Mucor saturninus]